MKMNTKRWTALLLLSLTIATTLAACDTGSSAPRNNNLPTPTTLQSSNSPTSAPGIGGTQTPPTTIQPAPTSTVPAGVGGSTPLVMTPNATTTSVSATPEQPVAPEQNPAGDIPDTQAFVKYSSAAGAYELDAPEGWARSENSPNVSFIDKLNGVMVAVTDSVSPPTVDSVRANEVAALQKSGRAVQVASVKAVTLPGGPAILVVYTSNSEPNSVTGKQVRLENNAYLIYKTDGSGHGKLATITLWAPVGADNVDQWQRMSQSFRWR